MSILGFGYAPQTILWWGIAIYGDGYIHIVWRSLIALLLMLVMEFMCKLVISGTATLNKNSAGFGGCSCSHNPVPNYHELVVELTWWSVCNWKYVTLLWLWLYWWSRWGGWMHSGPPSTAYSEQHHSTIINNSTITCWKNYIWWYQ